MKDLGYSTMTDAERNLLEQATAEHKRHAAEERIITALIMVITAVAVICILWLINQLWHLTASGAGEGVRAWLPYALSHVS